MSLTLKQKKAIEDTCRKYKEKMQKLVNQKGSSIDSISISFGNSEPIVIAEKPEEVKNE